MNCPHPDVLSAYADRQATPEETRLVEGHLAACEPCRLSLWSTIMLKARLAAQPMPAMPDELKSSLEAAARSAGASLEGTSSRWWKPVLAFSLAAAATVLALWWRGVFSGTVAPENVARQIERPAP